MDDQESSSGLMLGIVIGGAVVVVLVLLGFLGVGLFFFAGPAPGPPPEALVPVVEERPGAAFDAPAAKPIDDAPPGPNPKRVEQQKQRLIGTWSTTHKDGRKEIWELRADQTMDVTVRRMGKADEVRKVHWELMMEVGGPGLSIVQVSEKSPRVQQHIRFVDDDHFVLAPPVAAKIDGAAAEDLDGAAKFERKRVEEKP